VTPDLPGDDTVLLQDLKFELLYILSGLFRTFDLMVLFSCCSLAALCSLVLACAYDAAAYAL
jgi:hypothetical protein